MLDLNDIRKGVIEALARTVDAPDDGIDLSADLDDIGVDSLVFLRLKLTLEQTFRITLPDDFGDRLVSGDDVVVYLEKTLTPSGV